MPEGDKKENSIMDKKSKILIVVFIIIIFVSIFLTYKRAFIDKNFTVVEGESTQEEVAEEAQ